LESFSPATSPNVRRGKPGGRGSMTHRFLGWNEEVQAAYCRNWLATFTAQAEELRALSVNVTADTTEPIKAHVTRGVNELRKAS